MGDMQYLPSNALAPSHMFSTRLDVTSALLDEAASRNRPACISRIFDDIEPPIDFDILEA